MQPNERKTLTESNTVESSVEIAERLGVDGNSGNGPTESTQVIDRVINACDRERPAWEERGRVACSEGRELTPYPYGKTGLTAEGHIRAEAWVKGWIKQAVAQGTRSVEI